MSSRLRGGNTHTYLDKMRLLKDSKFKEKIQTASLDLILDISHVVLVKRSLVASGETSFF